MCKASVETSASDYASSPGTPVQRTVQTGTLVTTHVSVIVPVRCDARLAVCLDALSRQRTEYAFEVIVVDNDPTGTSRGIAERFGATYVLEPRPGSYVARMAGVVVAKGDWLAFTDADCRPTPTWINAGMRALRDDLDLIVGPVRTGPAPLGGSNPVTEYSRALMFDVEQMFRSKGTGVTANLWIARARFNAVGGFTNESWSGQDQELCRRHQRLGGRCRLADDVVVEHPPLASLKQLLGRTRRIAGGEFDMQQRSATGSPLPVAARAFLRAIPHVGQATHVWASARGAPPDRRIAATGLTMLTRWTSAIAMLKAASNGSEQEDVG